MTRLTRSASIVGWLAACACSTGEPPRAVPGAADSAAVRPAPHALWIDTEGRPTPDARAALVVLRSAAADGLDPAEYIVADISAPAAFDAALTTSMLRYLRHLHMGRVDPRGLGFRIAAPPDDHDFVAILRAAVDRHQVADLAAQWRPPFAMYHSVREALIRYRVLARDAANRPPPPEAKPVKPGQAASHLPALARWLRVLGDVPPGTPPPPSSRYEGAIVDGVKAFQARHGLEPDGVIGRATREALAVPLESRVRQLELALERLRWFPHLDDRVLAVNIPMFRLWGWEGTPLGGTPAFDMSVIVGKSLDTQTPVLIDQMTHVIFRPYWNVPTSILRGEVLPELARDRGYLDDQDMEIVEGQSDDGRVLPLDEGTLAQLGAGRLRVRQRPGPSNSLGLVKFVFPNDDAVYMHGTPLTYLFVRSRRDLSHGCVRVADPVGLAQWVLADQPDWTRARILAAMEGGSPSRVDLARPLQVVLFYLTAMARPDDGRVHFANDIYGHDRALERALGARGPAGPAGG